VAGHFGVGGIFTQGAQEQLGESKDHGKFPFLWQMRQKLLGTNLPAAGGVSCLPLLRREQKSHALLKEAPGRHRLVILQ
jgi:hypothetical protein